MSNSPHIDVLLFQPVSLQDLDKVSFLSRRDSKYMLNEQQLACVMADMVKQYRILEIEGVREFHYTSQYLDTPGFLMYAEHHNKRMNRYKLRRRVYEESGLAFWEIKYKTNRSITIKNRIKIKPDDGVNETVFSFVSRYSPFQFRHLEPKLISRFCRMTFVNNSFTERVTIDRFLSWDNDEQHIQLNGLAIIEIKNERKASLAKLYPVLKKHGIHKGSFSKYTFGCALLYSHLKKNLLKAKLHNIQQYVSSDQHSA